MEGFYENDSEFSDFLKTRFS